MKNNFCIMPLAAVRAATARAFRLTGMPAVVLLTMLTLLLCGCSDDRDVDQPQPDSGFVGEHKTFELGQESEGLPSAPVTITLQAADGTVFSREGWHVRDGGTSTFSLSAGLCEGVFRLLYLNYTPADQTSDQTPGEAFDDSGRREFGLGSRIEVDSHGIRVIDTYDRQFGMAGKGSADDPFMITSSTHLFKLMMLVNDYDGNRLVTDMTCFRQACDIDMKSMSRSCDAQYGWMPIGADTNTPFRGMYQGDGHAITNLICKRPRSAGVGLFGFIHDGAVDGLTVRNSTIEGQFAAGAIAGAVIAGGGGEGHTGEGIFSNCNVEESTVTGDATSVNIGGILGAVDMHTKVLVANCETRGGSVSGGMSVGGVIGGSGIYSSLAVTGCDNSSAVTSISSGAGGIVGTADTLQVTASRNAGRITGPASASRDFANIGTGGIAGGTGMSWISSSSNSGQVSGYEGVGGIIGSTRVSGNSSEGYTYNQTLLRYCDNTGQVSGTRFVGGAIGEAQAGGFSVCNNGDVQAREYAGGICGTSSVAVIHNCINGGRISGDSHIAGITGKTCWGSLALCQNVGSIESTGGWTGGIAGLVGNNTVIHYCSNFGNVTGGGWTGGIVGDVGEPRKWTGMDIAECVIGSLECVMAFAGPALAVFEGVAEVAHGVEIMIKITDITAEVILQAIDYALVGYSSYELATPEMEEKLEQLVVGKNGEITDGNRSLMASLRSRCVSGDCPLFPANDLGTRMMACTDRLVDWYNLEGNDEKFNERINERREERAESLEKAERAKEIFHTVVAGVAVVTSTVALIGAEVASGGAATAFVAVGATAALVGGVNAIVKSCTKFETNAVIISQCVNGSSVSGSDRSKAGSIAGRMCDGSVMNDCMNAVADSYGQFAADFGSHCEANHCISLIACSDITPDKALNRCVYPDPSMTGTTPQAHGDCYWMSVDAFRNPGSFSGIGFSTGADGLWDIPAGAAFPVPNYSEMQK